MFSQILKSLNQNLNSTEKERLLFLENEELISKNAKLAKYITNLTDNIIKERNIRDLIDKIEESLNLDETLIVIINEIANLTNMDRCIIYLTDPKEIKTYLYKEFRIQEGVKSVTSDLELTFLFDNHYKSIAMDNNAVLIENIDSDLLNDAQKRYLNFYNIKSLIITPITYNEELLGLILVHQNNLLCDWQDSHSELLRKISNKAALSIKHAILHTRLMQEIENRNKIIKNMPISCKNHINSIRGFSEMLLQQQNILTDNQRKYLTYIITSADLLNKALNDKI